MARPRNPLAKAIVTGATVKHPERYRNRGKLGQSALGKAPTWFSAAEVKAWELFRLELPWLEEADRALLEMVAQMRAGMMAGGAMGATKLNLYRLCLAQLGASPADRSKVSMHGSDHEDPGSEFFN